MAPAVNPADKPLIVPDSGDWEIAWPRYVGPEADVAWTAVHASAQPSDIFCHNRQRFDYTGTKSPLPNASATIGLAVKMCIPLLIACLAALPARSAELFPLEQVRAGMQGIGRTVFSDRQTQFKNSLKHYGAAFAG